MTIKYKAASLDDIAEFFIEQAKKERSFPTRGIKRENEKRDARAAAFEEAAQFIRDVELDTSGDPQ